MRTTLILSLLISAFSIAQEVDLYQITPSWSIGDSRTIHTETETTTYVDDTVFTYAKVTGDYKITVVDTVDVYSVKYAQFANDLDVELHTINDSVTNFAMDLMKKIQNKIAYLEYIVSIDKETGLATEIQNSKKLNDKVLKMTLEIIDDMGKERGKSASEVKAFQDNIVIFLDSLTPQMNQTVINSVNYLMQAYSYGFPIEETYQQEISAHDINAMGVFGTTEFPAIMTINSQETEDELIIYTSTDYDKEFLLKQMKKLSTNMDHFTTKDLFISEREQITIDLYTTWIKEHVSSVEMKIPKVRVVENSIIQFRLK